MYTSLVVSHFVDVFELNESSSAPFSLDNLFVWFFSEKIATGWFTSMEDFPYISVF